jgi:hypothetical protein
MQAVFAILAVVSYLTCIGVSIAGMWGAFSKAERPGWAAIVPIYNALVMIDIAGKPWWWLFLMMIPLAGVVFAIIIINEFVSSYGKGVGFTVGLILLPMVFWPLLGFGDAEYRG